MVVAEVDQDSASTFEGVMKGLGDEVLSAQQIGTARFAWRETAGPAGPKAYPLRAGP